jgi:hypothetical protein
MLGILVAEQIRFNTLEKYHKAFEDQGVLYCSLGELYFYLFSSFKARVYNNWGQAW